MRFCARCKDKNYLIECACGCGHIMSAVDNQYRYRKFVAGHCTRTWDQKGEKSASWKGGIYINSWGYRLKMRKGHPREDKNGYVFEHILNFEDYYKCCVLVWGNIHHIDHNKLNNMPENLEGMTSSDHTLYHNAHRVYKKWSPEQKLRFKSVPRDWHGRILPKSAA